MLNLEVKNANRLSRYAVPMETMGDRIRHLREARRMTQQQLADLCGVTKSAVSQWEGGSSANIRVEAFLLLADALGTDPRYLVWGSERGPLKAPGRARGRTVS